MPTPRQRWKREAIVGGPRFIHSPLQLCRHDNQMRQQASFEEQILFPNLQLCLSPQR